MLIKTWLANKDKKEDGDFYHDPLRAENTTSGKTIRN